MKHFYLVLANKIRYCKILGNPLSTSSNHIDISVFSYNSDFLVKSKPLKENYILN